LCIGILAFSGCGNAPADTPPLAPVTGTISFDGKPLTQGTIQFTPDSTQGTSGRMALGQIQSDGTYQLTTISSGDGAQVGHHIVTIQAYESTPFDPNNPKPTTTKSLLPERYADPAQSNLKAEVVAGKTNSIDFKLTTAP
jgi:hypothetical protein